MPAVKRSSHARLKAALVSRDALAAELGVGLVLEMKALRNVEEALGTTHGLENKYLEAIASVCHGEAPYLSAQ